MTNNLYSDWENRMNTLVGKDTDKYIYWKHLREANQKYKRLFPSDKDDLIKFSAWLKENYGIQTHIDSATQHIAADYHVIDEQKYLLFTLEFEK